MVEGSGSTFNIARVMLSVCLSAPVGSIENNRLVCRFIIINWISDSMLVSVSHIDAST